MTRNPYGYASYTTYGYPSMVPLQLGFAQPGIINAPSLPTMTPDQLDMFLDECVSQASVGVVDYVHNCVKIPSTWPDGSPVATPAQWLGNEAFKICFSPMLQAAGIVDGKIPPVAQQGQGWDMWIGAWWRLADRAQKLLDSIGFPVCDSTIGWLSVATPGPFRPRWGGRRRLGFRRTNPPQGPPTPIPCPFGTVRDPLTGACVPPKGYAGGPVDPITARVSPAKLASISRLACTGQTCVCGATTICCPGSGECFSEGNACGCKIPALTTPSPGPRKPLAMALPVIVRRRF